MKPGSILRTRASTPVRSVPVGLGTTWPMAFMVWWAMWQWSGQSPGTAMNSMSRIWPTLTSSVTSRLGEAN
jgi:hypothetical protein